jgi:hydroxyethylthiazole kinase-like uncharacterized protein yjeF
MNLRSSEDMRALDVSCAYFGLLPLQLMENAGAALAREVRARALGKRVSIVAGRGNNGGDAFVAARHLVGLMWTSIFSASPMISEQMRRREIGIF